MAIRLNKKEKATICLLGSAENGILYFEPDSVKTLVEKGFAEQNPGMEEVEGDGKFATRLTVSGNEKFHALQQAEEKEKEKEKEEATKIDTVVEEESVEEQTDDIPEEVDEALPALAEQEDEPEFEPEPEPKAKKSDFEIEKGIDISKVNRGRARGSYKYPFASMEVGDSFHVPVTKARPNPCRTLASTVSTASKRYDMTFRVRTVFEDDPKGPGARVFRVA